MDKDSLKIEDQQGIIAAKDEMLNPNSLSG